MNWWAWVIAGAILLGAELGFINAQFYLVFVGLSALVVGAVEFAVPAFPPWAEWVLFAALAVVGVTVFRRAMYERLRHEGPNAVQAGPAGEVVTLPSALAPGESCQIEYRGSFWTATNGGETAIDAGARARILHVRGLALVVRADATL